VELNASATALSELVRLMILFSGVWPVNASAFLGCEASELFFVVAYSGGDGLEGGAQGGDFIGEPGEGPAGVGAVAVLFDDRAQGGVAVEGGATQAGGDGGEGDLLAVAVELSAGALDSVERGGAGHPVRASLIRVSSWVMSRRWRSTSVIQPRFSASVASASTS
jgi:hypothetical protein